MFVLIFVFIVKIYIYKYSEVTFSLFDIIISVESFKFVEANFSGM